MNRYVLGISCFYHDSAAALIKDGEVIAAAQEERFTRKKHEDQFPVYSIEFCLGKAEIDITDIESIVFYEKPFLTFERLLETYISFAPAGFPSFIRSMPLWLKQKLGIRSMIRHELKKKFLIQKSKLPSIAFCYHHLSHAASAFYASPYESSAILCVDGVGEWATTTLWKGEGGQLIPLKELHFPHSLGLLYSAFTYHCGFRVNSGEYKLMGLAPYGEPKYVEKIFSNLIDVKEDGSFRLNMKFFDFAVGLKMTNSSFSHLFSCPPRRPDSSIDTIYMDLAASVQKVIEEIMIKLAKTSCDLAGSQNLCLAGGVALNCVANGKILQSSFLENLYIQPAAGDAGGALGAAWAYWHQKLKEPRRLPNKKDKMQNSFLGPEYSNDQVESYLSENKISFSRLENEDLCGIVAKLLAEGNVIGWFRGAMEFGPRALGGRSILADPRSFKMQSLVNLKVKFRESFRPLAPVVLKSAVAEYFKNGKESPYMILTFPVAKKYQRDLKESDKEKKGLELLSIQRSDIASVTHVDNSARVQTIDSIDNPEYYRVIEKFAEITGIPVLINTSFNVRGEPIVCNPHEALECFKNTDIDYLVIENCLIDKTLQGFSKEKRQWSENFVPD